MEVNMQKKITITNFISFVFVSESYVTKHKINVTNKLSAKKTKNKISLVVVSIFINIRILNKKKKINYLNILYILFVIV